MSLREGVEGRNWLNNWIVRCWDEPTCVADLGGRTCHEGVKRQGSGTLGNVM